MNFLNVIIKAQKFVKELEHWSKLWRSTLALRSIYAKKREFGNEALLSLSNEITIQERMNELKKRYLQKVIEHKNPIITSLINEFKDYARGRVLRTKKPLCDVILEIENETAQNPNPIQNNVIEGLMYSSYNEGHVR